MKNGRQQEPSRANPPVAPGLALPDRECQRTTAQSGRFPVYSEPMDQEV
jgi:hypothetical protein